jgi:hypothetical protein
MGLEIEDVPLTLNFASQMTLTFDIQAPRSSFAIRVEKLVGHSRCDDGGLHRWRAGGFTPAISNLYHFNTVIYPNF